MVLGTDLKSNRAVEISLDKSRVIFITGKRSYGKSYSAGVLVEEVYLASQHRYPRPLILLIDPLGIYFTFCQSNPEHMETPPLPPYEGGIKGGGISLPVRLLVPGDPENRYGRDVVSCMEHIGVNFHRLQLNPNSISPSSWCELLDFSINEPLGIALFRAVHSFRSHFFTIDQLIQRVMEDPRSQDNTKEALLNRLEMAAAWEIFSLHEQDISEQLDPNYINVLDLSVLDPGAYGLANLIVSVLCRTLFISRVKAKRREYFSLAPAGGHIWLIVDEAQRFVPAGKSTLSKEILISWVKEGRQPGLSAVIMSQQAGIDNEILSQCDLIICHRISNHADIAAVNRLSHDYLGSELKTYLKHLKHHGEALLLDDLSERIALLKIKPRRTLHGGSEHLVLEETP